jgi:hypothetical protein
MKIKIFLSVILIGVLCLMGTGSALAITFSTPAGAELDNLPVSASADFTFGTDTITIKLWNTQADPKAVIQNISDLRFDLSTGQTTGTLVSSEGLERNVAADGTFSDPNTGTKVPTGWVLIPDGTGLKLNGLGTATFVPAHTIIGPGGGGGTYANANSSIAGNGPHNPFLFGTALDPVTFVLNVEGVDEFTTVSNVVWSFGTTPGNNVPLPPSALLLGSGLLSLGLLGGGFRRKRKG